MEIGFRGAPGCFQGMQVYIGERSQSGEPQGAHEGGGHASLPRDLLDCFSMSTPSLLDCVCSKNNSPEGFIPFDIPFLRNTEIGKKEQFALGLWLVG